ncbi:unnamed protein product [Amoebophrya sp. A25]|nr:unnamed protein product [Amoebophrya sp. A25]|eukprot:GSA25T00022406001.1
MPGEFDILAGFFRERGTALYQFDLRAFYGATGILAAKAFFALWRRPFQMMPWNPYLLFLLLELALEIPLMIAVWHQYTVFARCWYAGSRRHARLVERERQKCRREKQRHVERLQGKRLTVHSGTNIFREGHRSGSVRAQCYNLAGLGPRFQRSYLIPERDRLFAPLLLDRRRNDTTVVGGRVSSKLDHALRKVEVVDAMQDLLASKLQAKIGAPPRTRASPASNVVGAATSVVVKGKGGPGVQNLVGGAKGQIAKDQVISKGTPVPEA